MIPKELRIGNLVNKIVSNNTFETQMHKVIASDLYDDECEWFEPIPLSEDLLLKCGAINKFGRTYFIGKLKFDINTLNIVRFHYSGKVVYIYYLHQLQNLWHSLCNEELQIKL